MSKTPMMHLQTSFTWAAKRLVNRIDWSGATTDVEPTVEKDTRKSVRAEDLDSGWIQALETADYSHLPKLKKQTA